MPYKPKRPCAYLGCGRLAESEQYCAEHKKVMGKQYNRYDRDPASNKRYGVHGSVSVINTYLNTLYGQAMLEPNKKLEAVQKGGKT